MIRSTRLQGRDIPHLKEIADNLKGNTPQTSLVSFLDNNGSLLYSTKGLDLNIVRSYDWYSLALNSNTTYITGIYYSYTIHDYAIALVDPIRDNNTILGRTLVLIQPQALQDSIQSQLINPDENVIIVDRNGLLLSHDNRTQLGLLTNVSSYTAVRNVLHGEEGVVEDRYTWDGQSRISAFYLTPDLGWGVIVSTPTSLIYQPLKSEAIMMSGMLLVFILVLLGVGYFVSNYLTAPMIHLSQTMQKISAGSYNERAMIRRNDETGDMAQKFNAMMDELAHAEKAREDAKEEAELYVDLLGHDINNMNQVALGYIELSMDAIQHGNYDLSLLEQTKETLFNSSALIDNVRKIQRIKAGELEPEVIDLGSLLSDIIDKHRSIPGRDVRIDFHKTCDCKVLASNLLRDVFSNLIGNAIKHSTGPLTIDIELTKIREDDHSYCMVAVSDNGPGISDEKKSAIFKRFMRGTTKAKGSGLGLYIVKSLVESFKGRVWVEDRVAGDYTKGCRFIVILPEFDIRHIT